MRIRPSVIFVAFIALSGCGEPAAKKPVGDRNGDGGAVRDRTSNADPVEKTLSWDTRMTGTWKSFDPQVDSVVFGRNGEFENRLRSSFSVPEEVLNEEKGLRGQGRLLSYDGDIILILKVDGIEREQAFVVAFASDNVMVMEYVDYPPKPGISSSFFPPGFGFVRVAPDGSIDSNEEKWAKSITAVYSGKMDEWKGFPLAKPTGGLREFAGAEYEE